MIISIIIQRASDKTVENTKSNSISKSTQRTHSITTETFGLKNSEKYSPETLLALMNKMI